MGKRRDDTHSEFPDIEAQSEASSSAHDFKVVGDETAGLDDGKVERRIGRYRLIRPIGEGGMGVVWRAVQEHPVRRDVALKLVREGLGTDALARFEAERQAIAMMDHPNIAKILDADTTENGTPYFVMELVKGIPLDQYCNHRKLSIEARLRLMLSVCHAVQHAHQKAILHRDLKHSNILVSENDDKPTPKVIDFGLAKAMGSQKTLTDKTVYTEFGKVVGTIYYMSPEQADSDGTDIDTRSDIYSLGVVLYKLLTGSTPVQIEGESDDNGLSVIGAIKIIREKDPIAPSLAIRKNQNCIDWVADNTNLKSDRHADQIKGDLDSIVLKALEKDRRSRYETANELAMDIERFLNKEPVLAQPRSTTYTIRKFVQRNKGLVASLATIAVLLVGGIVATSLSLMLAISATNRAELNAQLAKVETEKAKTVEKLRSVQLKAQLNKSAWSDLQRGNVESAWQSLRRMYTMDKANVGWVGRFLANEMDTCKPEDIMQGGHAHYVLTLDVSSKGDYIVSGGGDDTVYLWDARSNRKVYKRTFDDIVKCVRFSSDQSRFAVADRSNIISIFDTSTGELIHTFGKFEQDATSLCFHPHQPILACGFFGKDSRRSGMVRMTESTETQEANLVFVNIETKEVLQTITAHPDEITSVAFDASGDRLVSSCVDGKLRVWEFRKPTESEPAFRYTLERTIAAHPSAVDGVQKADISRSGKRIVSCGNDKVACLWDGDTGELMANLAGHSREVLGVAISPKGDLVATASNDGTAIIWNLEGEPITTWRGHTQPINEVRFTIDGEQIVTASDDQTLRRWSVRQAGVSVVHRFRDTLEIWRAGFSPDKETVAAASEKGVVHLIGSRNGKLKKDLDHDGAVLSLAWLSDGRLITAGDNFGLWVWDRLERSEEKFDPSRKVPLPESLIWDLCLSPNEDRVVIASSDHTARVFDTKHFKELAVLEGHEEGLASAKFSPDGKLIVTACDDSSIKVWDAKSYEYLYSLDDHSHPVWRIAFSPTDPNLFASSTTNGEILVWDLKKKQPLPVSFVGHKDAVAGLTFTIDGRSLVSACDDATVRVWDVETGVELFVFQNAFEMVIDASFSKDGQSLVTSGVGAIHIRHANKTFSAPYMQRDAIEDTIAKHELVTDQNASPEQLEEIVAVSMKVVRHFPTWSAWENLGVAQWRLDRFDDSVESLEEAFRLKKILHNTPETEKPLTEGYLVMALARIENHDKARQVNEEFERCAAFWEGDQEVESLRSKIKFALKE